MTNAKLTITEREKPKLYTANNCEITLKKPLGFANHSAVLTAKLKEKTK